MIVIQAAQARATRLDQQLLALLQGASGMAHSPLMMSACLFVRVCHRHPAPAPSPSPMCTASRAPSCSSTASTPPRCAAVQRHTKPLLALLPEPRLPCCKHLRMHGRRWCMLRFSPNSPLHSSAPLPSSSPQDKIYLGYMAFVHAGALLAPFTFRCAAHPQRSWRSSLDASKAPIQPARLHPGSPRAVRSLWWAQPPMRHPSFILCAIAPLQLEQLCHVHGNVLHHRLPGHHPVLPPPGKAVRQRAAAQRQMGSDRWRLGLWRPHVENAASFECSAAHSINTKGATPRSNTYASLPPSVPPLLLARS